mmetsp:Transcript_28559/g.88367  ORF Transcript_28559/g.88367 Transcript_28559/m.88367 type:complete len:262 (+) Transcript_28559:147-932(+)
MSWRALLVIASTGSTTRACVPRCRFDGADPPDCVVYGQLGDGELIAFHRASQDCLDQFSIKDQAVDEDQLEIMFPNADGTGGRPSAFVSWLRFDGGAVVESQKASFPQIFVEVGGKMVLRDAVALDGVQGGNEINCDPASACWQAFKLWLGDRGADEMADVGRTLWARMASSRELEQALVRVRLCSDGDPAAVCAPLAAQVADLTVQRPDKACSAFGLGPGSRDLPDCAPGGNGTNATDAAAGRAVVSSAATVCVAAVALL